MLSPKKNEHQTMKRKTLTFLRLSRRFSHCTIFNSAKCCVNGPIRARVKLQVHELIMFDLEILRVENIMKFNLIMTGKQQALAREEHFILSVSQRKYLPAVEY
jgi:hypothetical protein